MTLPYREEHEIFRSTVRKFVEAEIAPHHAQWEKDGMVGREIWRRAGAAGLLCTGMPMELGGGGGDFLYSVIMTEELVRHLYTGPGFRLHSDVVAPYILHYGSDAQQRRWLPKMAAGETITAIAMTEPTAGSDLQNIRTTAIRQGDSYLINGQKTFITNGQLADLVIVAAKTDPGAGATGLSLLLVETDRPGFSRGRNLEKIGMKAQDTSELFLSDVQVPATNLIGEPGRGFRYLMSELPRERLLVAIMAVTIAESAVLWTIDHVTRRSAFGAALAALQNTRFRLAEMKTELTVARTFLDHCIELQLQDELPAVTAAMAKWWTTELEGRIVDQCVQLHGGYGYMWEYPIARAYAEARIHRIYAGSNEILKELVARSFLQ